MSQPDNSAHRSRLALLFSAASLLAACSGGEAKGPLAGPPPDFGAAYADALAAEAIDPLAAGRYLDLLDKAVANPDAPGALAAATAAVDALATGQTTGFEPAGPHAIAFRSRDLMPLVVERLRAAWAAGDGARSATGPFIRGAIAAGLHQLALFGGDPDAADLWGSRRGCARAAAVVGPLDWTPLRALEDASPIAHGDPLAESYAGIAPFGAKLTPGVVSADQCLIDVNSTSYLQGLRAVVVDLAVPRAQTIHLALTSSSAASVDVGGVPVIRRGYDAGGRPVMRLGSIDVPEGRVRVVVRVAQRGDGNLIELDAFGDDGAALVAHAPQPGEASPAAGGKARPVEIAPAPGPHGALLAAAGLLALGEARAAEHLLEVRPAAPAGAPAEPSPALDLVYARALEAADDLPDVKVVSRIRDAIDRVLAAWPASWEAKAAHARATERRRGAGEGPAEALRELGAAPKKPAPPGKPDESAKPQNAAQNPMISAYVAILARRMQYLDVAERAYADLAKQIPGAPLLAGVDARLHARFGADAVRAACLGGTSRADVDCYEAHRDRGDLGAALAELERLRRLRGAPEGLRELQLSTQILQGDLAGALATYDQMKPGQRRMLDALGFAAGKGDAEAVRTRLARDHITARDAPYAINPIVRALGLEADPAPKLEEEGRKLILADQKAAFLPGAATAVLRHVERYEIEPSGLVHYVLHDVRRVSGTTDVAQGAVSYGPQIEGRGAPRLLRKRIHKRDGRVLNPDAASNSAQQSDLSQLEQGDYVEQIVEGRALPGDTGQLVLDTPDLLPERTSVREAIIEIRRPAALPLAIWSHPLLGRAEERLDGAAKVQTWHLKNQAPRRIEDGIPKMERAVAVSLGTQTWTNVARAIQENVRSLDERDPYVKRWAEEAAGADRAVSRALVERVVAATGKRVKVAGGAELSDVAAMFGGGAQRTTARTILELQQGSRSWVIYRVLRELGVKVDLAVAEGEPFSQAPDFPAHAGRFRHPLVVARLGAEAGGDLWIDADVEGPPLPPGRLSPELRGRQAMLESGEIVTVQGSSGETGDEVDIRLVLDDKGDARGSFTVLLHGRTAQALAEAFETVVGTERREMLRAVVLGWVPWADVDDVSVSSSEGSWEVALRAKIEIHGFGRPEGKDGKTWVLAGLEPVHIGFPRAAVGTLAGTYASRGARQNALSIEAPLQYHLRRKIELPAGATVTRAPAGVTVATPHLQAKRSGAYAGKTLEDDFMLNLPTGTIAAEAYSAFVEKVQAIDDAFMAGTRVRVKP